MEKNIRCPVCHANAFHLDRNEDGMYVLKCMTGKGCTYEFECKKNPLKDLK